jgi:hypothetical protein
MVGRHVAWSPACSDRSGCVAGDCNKRVLIISGGRDPLGEPRDSKCPRIFPITAGVSMLATTFTLPPHCSQVSISIPNTRFSRCAQLMARCRSAGVRRSVVMALPRPFGVTSARQRLCSANTP